jgi:rhodanese-related sulfurtransferase
VREPDEFAPGHVEGALHVPLGELAARIDEVPKDRPVVAYCAHGERAATAVSLLERAGVGPLLGLDGGVDAWREAGERVVVPNERQPARSTIR